MGVKEEEVGLEVGNGSVGGVDESKKKKTVGTEAVDGCQRRRGGVGSWKWKCWGC
jgi:hypothetical protein